MKVYQFRVFELHRRWEDLPPVETLPFEDCTQAAQHAEKLVILYNNEVRYNEVGSTQGHYAGADVRFNRYFRRSR